jgi:hypothetical protein
MASEVRKARGRPVMIVVVWPGGFLLIRRRSRSRSKSQSRRKSRSKSTIYKAHFSGLFYSEGC